MEKFTTFKRQYTVQESDTAEFLGSGGLPVFSTPSMIAYMEKTAYLMLKGALDAEHSDQTTVGIEIQIEHLAPTPVGKEVTVKVTLLDANKKIYTLQVEAMVDGQLIGKGTHKRAVVDPVKFMERVK